MKRIIAYASFVVVAMCGAASTVSLGGASEGASCKPCGDAYAGLPFSGTQGMGNVTPAACVPFGLVQAGPDTTSDPLRYHFDKAHCGGYQYADEYVWRFSQTHVSGMGCAASGNIGLLPVTDATGLPDRGERMAKETETASPGHYGVTLSNGVRCDIAADSSKAEYRFTFPKGARAQLVVDLDWALGEPEPMAEGEADSVWGRTVKDCSCRFDDARNIRGFQRVRVFVEHTLYFAGRFSRDIVGARLLRESDGLRGETWLVDFGESDGGPLAATIALSIRDAAEAMRRLDGESVDGVAEWGDWFSRVTLDPSTDALVRANFAAAMYHLAFQPNRASGSGNSSRYVQFSLWDTFRAAHPLYTILAPECVDGFVNSLLTEYRSRGYLPILSVWGRDTHCMIGHHAVPVIVDAYLKGFRGFDAEEAGAAIRDSLTVDHVPESTACWGFTKEDWRLYDTYGYYPHDLLRTRFRGRTLCGESVSRTLECAYDDACAARFFAAVGDATNATFFARRAGFWKNVFDPQTGFMRGRDSKGVWRTPFDPGDIGYGPWAERDFTEGNSYQYTWHVMQDPEGLVAAMGGKRAAGEKLDQLFQTRAKERSYDVSGLIGQYAHGNEVSHHIAYFYAFTDRPWRTAEIVREVFDTQYKPGPDGLSGNDDCGQMSAWYIFSALGFYPFDPCGGEYVLGAPQVPKVTLNLQCGKTFTVMAKNLSCENKYVKSVTLNGSPVAGRKIRHADIVAGGELVFEMSKEP